MDEFSSDIESSKNGNVYHDFCVNDALSHLKNARAALEARLDGDSAKEYYNDAIAHSKWVMRVMPIAYILDELQNSD